MRKYMLKQNATEIDRTAGAMSLQPFPQTFGRRRQVGANSVIGLTFENSLDKEQGNNEDEDILYLHASVKMYYY